jgi:hypothetical protein
MGGSVNHLMHALRWRSVAACTRFRHGWNLLGWARHERVAFAAGPELAVVLCTWRRLERLADTLAQLAAQDIPVQAVIWNNSPYRSVVDEIVAAAAVPATVHHSDRNIGGFGRFYLARELAAAGHETVIFLDDDHDAAPSMARELLRHHRPRTMSGWWAFRFVDDDYANRERVAIGESASYLGTCGMICDTAIFDDPRVFACPKRYWFVEDLWLSFVASALHGWPLFRSAIDLEWVQDGRDQFHRLGMTKTRFLRHLIRRGWNLDVARRAPGPVAAEPGIEPSTVLGLYRRDT